MSKLKYTHIARATPPMRQLRLDEELLEQQTREGDQTEKAGELQELSGVKEPMIAIVSIPLHFHWQEFYSGALAYALAYLPDHHSKFPAPLPRAFHLRTKGANRNRTSPQEPGLPAWSCSSPTNQCLRRHKHLPRPSPLPQTTWH